MIIRRFVKAYEIVMGSIVVFFNSMFFAGMVAAVTLYLFYQLVKWAAWSLSM